MGRPYYFLILKEHKLVYVLLTIYWCLLSTVNYCVWQKEQGRVAAPLS